MLWPSHNPPNNRKRDNNFDDGHEIYVQIDAPPPPTPPVSPSPSLSSSSESRSVLEYPGDILSPLSPKRIAPPPPPRGDENTPRRSNVRTLIAGGGSSGAGNSKPTSHNFQSSPAATPRLLDFGNEDNNTGGIGAGRRFSQVSSLGSSTLSFQSDMFTPDLQSVSTGSTFSTALTPSPSMYDQSKPFQVRQREQTNLTSTTEDSDEDTLTDDENDFGDDDDDNSLDGSEEEKFEKAVMKVSKRDGIVTLEYLEEEKENQESDLGEEDNDTDEGSSGSLDEFHDAHEKFDLISTNVHVEEDKRKMELEKIRRVVLDVASKAYTKNGLDLPDDLLAQINENHDTTDRGGLGEHFRKVQKTLNKRDGKIVAKNNGRDEKNSKIEKKDNENDMKNQRRKIVKKLKLDRHDEIHALPCQCALALVGLRTNSGGGSTMAQHSTPAMFGSSFTNSYITTATPPPKVKRKQQFSQYPSSTGGSEPSLRQGKYASPPQRNSGKMVRTVSGNADAARAVPKAGATALCFNTSKANLKTGSPTKASTVRFAEEHNLQDRRQRRKQVAPLTLTSSGASYSSNRDDTPSYTPMHFHEITIIRNTNRCSFDIGWAGGWGGGGNVEKNTDKEEFVEWEALTIRCSDHDEMDVLIRALRKSARATVVPFSPNPKAKLRSKAKKRAAAAAAAKKKRASTKKSRKTRQRSETSSTTNADFIVGLTNEKEMLSLSALTSSPIRDSVSDFFSQSPIKLKAPDGQKKKKKERDSANWNKTDHCELCGFLFTLLTRRHHCRKCNISCCADCSSIMLVRGGDEIRYCNPCSAVELRKQSHAAHRRLALRQRRLSAVLPGRVHPECRNLGVGVLGKLPHWRNYITLDPDLRPAVGRITVELIQALALPSVYKGNGKADPYVRATITGYDRDLKWTLREWLPEKRFSLCSKYCTSTLSPMWRGLGRKGGELLTLPVISTAGAVLRLEVLHYDVLTNARGKDCVIGIVEIPLSDLTNANLRSANLLRAGTTSTISKKLGYDGYSDIWYRLQNPADVDKGLSVVSKPIEDPQKVRLTDNDDAHTSDHSDSLGEKLDQNERRKLKRHPGNQSLQEIGKRTVGLCVAPVEWMGSALRIDMPRRPESQCISHKSRSAIHVRIKLNASEMGDFLSHTWFPPVRPLPPHPPYDPQVLYRNVVRVLDKLSPYQKLCKFVEDVIKWRHPPKTCVISYFVFVFHVFFIKQLIYFLHIHLLFFLWKQHTKMTDKEQKNKEKEGEKEQPEANESFPRLDSSRSSSRSMDSTAKRGNASWGTSGSSGAHNIKSENAAALQSDVAESPSLEDLRQYDHPESSARSALSVGSDGNASSTTSDEKKKKTKPSEDDKDTARLHKVVSWVAMKLGENKGLEVVQFKLGMLGRDLTNLNSLWDGSSAIKTKTTMVVLSIAFVIHFFVNVRYFWIISTALWYFGSSPHFLLLARYSLGFWRGLAKIARRRHLHYMEIQQIEMAKDNKNV